MTMIHKYNASKRLLSILLAIVMCMTMIPATAFAADDFVASVTPAEGEPSYYTDINEAITEAMANSGSTLKLLTAITTDSTVTIDSGSFTIDLGGNTWTFSSEYLKISGDANITITDSTDGAGKLSGTYYQTIALIDSATLEIAGGTVENTASRRAVEMSDSGITTNAQLIVSGGKVITNGTTAINAFGSLVKVTGGTIESNREDIGYATGVIDLSEHNAPTNIKILNNTDTDVTVSDTTIKLPDGYVMLDDSGNPVESLALYETYTVGKVTTPEPEPEIPANAVASVTPAEGEPSYHDNINAAITAAMAAPGSTLTLLDAINTDSDVTIDSGSFTIDLNGKTWTSSVRVMYIRGSADIKITDSFADGTGKLLGTGSANHTILLYGDAKLEIAGGTVENTGGLNAVDMSNGGMTTNAQLTVSGGKVITNGTTAIFAYGSLVKATGGTIKSNDHDIYYNTGVIDLSGHKDPTGITIYNATGAEVTPGENTIMLPDGYVMLDGDGNAVESLAARGTYTVGGGTTPEPEPDPEIPANAVASVTTASDVIYYYDNINAAITAAMAAPGSTLTLLDAINTDSTVTIDSGSFTIDLGGKTWTSSVWVMYIRGSADIKITDSSADATGKLLTTGGEVTIRGYDDAVLEIAGGTVENTGAANAVLMSDSNELIVSGGTVRSNSPEAIHAGGSLVKVTGGMLESKDWDIYYRYGTIDLSEHSDPTGITIIVPSTAEAPSLGTTIKLPDGYVMLDFSGNAVSSLAPSGSYTVRKVTTPEPEPDPDPEIPANAVVSVTTASDVIYYYDNIYSAIGRAQENQGSTLKLLDDIDASVTINGGKFTIDLNGKTWKSADELILAEGSPEFKIIDSSEKADGLMTSSEDVGIKLLGESKLEIAGGNFSNSYNEFIQMQTNGKAVSSELLISGGKFVCNCVVRANGRKVTVTGGEFECAWDWTVEHAGGILDLSNYKGTSEIIYYVMASNDDDVSALELILPEGAAIVDFSTGEPVDELYPHLEAKIVFPEPELEIPAGSVASVTTVGGETSYHTDFNAAIDAAKQNSGSTLKLLDNISRGSKVTINSGSFTIDLNGKTWYSSGDVLRIEGTDTNITITDSMNGGTLDAGGLHAIDISGGSVKINGGTIPAKRDAYGIAGGWIGYFDGAGELDLSAHNDPAGIVIYTNGSASEKPVIKLPAGYVLYDTVNYKHVTEPEWIIDYEVVKDPNAPTTYTVTVTAGEGGTVIADKTTAAEHETVTLTVKPETGYRLDTLTVTGTSGAVETIAGEDNKYTFTMPAEAVTVAATFKEMTTSEIISVNITWGAMSFTYTDGEWNPETHTYGDGEWIPDADGGNVITVTNNGNVTVNVAFSYDKTVAEVEGSFTDESGNAITSPFALAAEEEKKIKLILNGKPSSTFENKELGIVTVSITLPEG